MRYLMLIIILGLFLLPILAQEDEPTPYEIALQRIEEARVSGAWGLDLWGLGLTELPPEIGNLTYLSYLHLGGNELKSVPSEIGLLQNLQTLMLNHNQITSLPPEIGNLQKLIRLDLMSNQLTSLPPEIGNLQSLEELSLLENHLTSLPPEIGNLKNLCRLGISDNQIQHLPIELGNLPFLGRRDRQHCWSYPAEFLLENNPLISPPPEVIAQGTPAILEYLRNEAWWHMQRLIAGGVGAIGIVASLILGIRWRNRRRYEKKKKA